MIKLMAGVGAAVLALSGAPRQTLRVVVSGDGRVVSVPTGIACKPACTLHVKKRARVELVAFPNAGAVFSRWSRPCGTSRRCAVRMTAAKTVRAYFIGAPAAKPGLYTGTYTDGTTFDFDVRGTSMTNLSFDFNGACDNGARQAGPLTTTSGAFPIGRDGSVSGHITLTYGNATGSADFSGTLTPAGSGSGMLKLSITVANGGPTCTSSGTWTARTS